MPLRDRLLEGLVIPAHPLALDASRRLDERRQRALTRYYLAAGAGGVAVGVHTTQFAIREPRHGLLRPVLELAAEELRGREADKIADLRGAAAQALAEVELSAMLGYDAGVLSLSALGAASADEQRARAVVKIAGLCGPTPQALAEAELAASLGYDAGLLSLGALRAAPVEELLAHSRAVAAVIPIIGFYLQPSVGGRPLPFEFWRRFVEIDNVVAVKIAPFNRYQTLDVVRAVALSGRAREIALYTGNDDNIVADLLTEFQLGGENVRFAGGLLGQWAVWTRKAVELLQRIHSLRAARAAVPAELLTLAARLTDANAALFDPAHQFRGCIPGIHEVLRRQGLLAGRWCLDPEEELSPGQGEEIDRVCALYPELNDDEFVRAHVDEWLR
jgi:dihydrodipicolinate synthase/N-acetylneuraminate lyase